MADKSPRQHMSKKAGKSLKEKRVEKHLKAIQHTKGVVRLPRQYVGHGYATTATRAQGRTDCTSK